MNKLKKVYSKEYNIKSDTEEKTIMTLDCNNTENTMTFYHVMPGIELAYNQFNSDEWIREKKFDCKNNIIEINYCKQGRYGCTINGKQYVYLGEGEIEANILGIPTENEEFPLGFYYGISIIIDTEEAEKYLEPIFPEEAKQIEELKKYLLNNNFAVLIKKMPELEHIFNELYNIDKEIQLPYMKLKVLEILLIMQVIPLDRNSKEKRYYAKKDLEKVRAIHDEIISNLDKKITLNELSTKYDMSLTNLKNCFKEVYGKPYYTYLKKYKIHKAVHYLTETNLSISQIAGKLGYDNSSKFIAAFKSITNYTPREFKNKNVFLEHLKLFGVEIK